MTLSLIKAMCQELPAQYRQEITFSIDDCLKMIQLLEDAKDEIKNYADLVRQQGGRFEEVESWLKSLAEFEGEKASEVK